MKGDISDESDIDQVNLVLQGDVTQDHFSRVSVADLDNNGNMEIVVSTSKLGTGGDGYLFATERNEILWWVDVDEKWTFTLGYPIEAQPSLGNVDSNKRKEVVFGLTNGTLFVLNISADGRDVSVKWTYTVDEKYSPTYGDNIRGELGYTAIADIDFDGKNEIIFADSQPGIPDWDADLYVLEKLKGDAL
ncbi:hypothetical protein HQ529_04725 [Candidatus Woesearchaeota archaeon]|nr:hypothetical protein [Candidatus Woesearchaeota archaeon]